MTTSNIINKIKPSATLALSSKVKQMKSEGVNVIGFGAGEPDFDTPQHIKDAAIVAINAGDTKYTNVDGTPALKQAIILSLPPPGLTRKTLRTAWTNTPNQVQHGQMSTGFGCAVRWCQQQMRKECGGPTSGL